MKLSEWMHNFPSPLNGTAALVWPVKSCELTWCLFVRPCSQLQVAQGILDAQSIVDQLEGKIVNNVGGQGGDGDDGDDGDDGNGRGKGKGRGRGRRGKGKKLANALNDLRASIGQAREGVALALQGGLGVLAAQGKSIRGLFENAGLAVPPGF